jgi:SPP1 family predicted phage head-tail adaptor
MRAATLRLPITVVEPTRVANDSGGATYADAHVIDLYARQLSSREAERYTGGQLEGVTRRVYEVRYCDGLTSKMDIIHGSDRLRITGLEDPDEGRKRRLLVTCELRAAAA